MPDSPLTLRLIRLTHGTAQTFGALVFGDKALCVTVEKPWRNNDPNFSCIPLGRYHCVPHSSPKHPDTWEVTGVQNRSAILIHPANFASQLQGCIAPGLLYARMANKQGKLEDGVSESREAMAQLHGILGEQFDLLISNAL